MSSLTRVDHTNTYPMQNWNNSPLSETGELDSSVKEICVLLHNAIQDSSDYENTLNDLVKNNPTLLSSINELGAEEKNLSERLSQELKNQSSVNLTRFCDQIVAHAYLDQVYRLYYSNSTENLSNHGSVSQFSEDDRETVVEHNEDEILTRIKEQYPYILAFCKTVQFSFWEEQIMSFSQKRSLNEDERFNFCLFSSDLYLLSLEDTLAYQSAIYWESIVNDLPVGFSPVNELDLNYWNAVLPYSGKLAWESLVTAINLSLQNGYFSTANQTEAEKILRMFSAVESHYSSFRVSKNSDEPPTQGDHFAHIATHSYGQNRERQFQSCYNYLIPLKSLTTQCDYLFEKEGEHTRIDNLKTALSFYVRRSFGDIKETDPRDSFFILYNKVLYEVASELFQHALTTDQSDWPECLQKAYQSASQRDVPNPQHFCEFVFQEYIERQANDHNVYFFSFLEKRLKKMNLDQIIRNLNETSNQKEMLLDQWRDKDGNLPNMKWILEGYLL